MTSTTYASLKEIFDSHDIVDIGQCELIEPKLIPHSGIDYGRDIELADGFPVVVIPGWMADDGNAEVEYPDAESGSEAAEEYGSTGDWGSRKTTSWITVYAWQRGYALTTDGGWAEVKVNKESHSITLEAEEPECVDGEDHEWESPYSLFGGCKENPGCWGHGGGVIIKSVCVHCGRYKITDTWAQDPSNGQQGLTSVAYEDADEDSMAWVESQRAEAEDE